jgi:cobalt/nickel transport system ATP-binding protein
MAAVSPAAVRLQGVSFRYPDGQQALVEVSLDVPAGGTVGIVGANGAGKSTLLMHVNGLLRGTGEVVVDGTRLTDRTLAEIRGRVGFLFQSPDDQLFMPTAWDDVAFGPRSAGLGEAEVSRRVQEALAAVRMEAAASRPPHHLSLGQKKRVAIATVLALECGVLALDEPSSGLDPRGRRDLSALLAGLPQTQLIATHDLEFVLERCDRVVVLREGSVVADGAPVPILSDAALMEDAGLEVPPSLR